MYEPLMAKNIVHKKPVTPVLMKHEFGCQIRGDLYYLPVPTTAYGRARIPVPAIPPARNMDAVNIDKPSSLRLTNRALSELLSVIAI